MPPKIDPGGLLAASAGLPWPPGALKIALGSPAGPLATPPERNPRYFRGPRQATLGISEAPGACIY